MTDLIERLRYEPGSTGLQDEAADYIEQQEAELTTLREKVKRMEVLFDGYAVYSALDDHTKKRTSPENVSDTLDAVVRLIWSRRAARIKWMDEQEPFEVIAFRGDNAVVVRGRQAGNLQMGDKLYTKEPK